MQTIRNYDNPENKVQGYRQFWYAASEFWRPTNDKMIRVSAEKLNASLEWLRWKGVKLFETDQWRPAPVPYVSTFYCFDKLVAVYSLMKPKPVKFAGLPRATVALISPEQKFIKDAAKKLELPLEKLVLVK